MVKKCSIVLGLGTFLLLSTLPSAQAAAPKLPNDGAFLGTVEGALSSCSKIKAQALPSYRQLDLLLTSGQSANAIAQVRNSHAYESAYQQVIKSLKALPANEASAACSGH
jgi:hypothetical protein